MRIEAIGSSGYAAGIYAYEYEAFISSIKRMEVQKRRWITQKKERWRKYLRHSNRLAMEMSGVVAFYDAAGQGHPYAYCNFETII